MVDQREHGDSAISSIASRIDHLFDSLEYYKNHVQDATIALPV